MTLQMVPAALGLLIGNPIAGAILKNGWPGLQIFSAALIVSSAAYSMAARVVKAGVAIKTWP